MLAPALTPGVVEHQLVVTAKTLIQVGHCLVRRGGKGLQNTLHSQSHFFSVCHLIHIEEEGVCLLKLQVLPDECQNPTDLLVTIHLQWTLEGEHNSQAGQMSFGY